MTNERVRRLEAAMADLRPRRVEGEWHRFVAELYKDEADSDQGALEHGGRYNPRREFGALYLSESPAASPRLLTSPIRPHGTSWVSGRKTLFPTTGPLRKTSAGPRDVPASTP